MTTQSHLDSERRHDFVLFFDVTDGNPNGDPDAGNLPRVDPETMQGLVTDVAIKRKVRDFVDVLKGREGRYKIYVQGEGVALNDQQNRAFIALEMKPKKKNTDPFDQARARKWMCSNFYDVRTFGAVMTTGDAWCGQVRGPVQLTFARSVDPITPLDLTITRIAVTESNNKEKRDPDNPTVGVGESTMGRKSIVPYGLYRAHGFVTPHLAAQTSFANEDLELFWDALINMWDLDHSAARGMMSCRGLYIFTHERPTGNAPAHKLFDRVTVTRDANVEAPRAFSDYLVSVDEAALPQGVSLTKLAI